MYLTKRSYEVLLLTGVALVIMVLLVWPLALSYRAPWVSTVLNAMHVPASALIVLVLNRLGLRTAAILSLAGLIVLGAELIQIWTGRTASFADAWRGCLGILLGMSLLGLLRGDRSVRTRVIAACIAAGSLAAAMADSCPTLFDAISAYREFPVISDFQSPFSEQRWRLQSAHLQRVSSEQAPGGWLGRLHARPHKTGETSGLVMFPVVRDWSSYRQLVCEFSFEGEPLTIQVSVRDGRKVEAPLRRFEFDRQYEAGSHQLVVDLRQLRAGGNFAPVEIANVQSFHFGVKHGGRNRQLDLHRVYLR